MGVIVVRRGFRSTKGLDASAHASRIAGPGDVTRRRTHCIRTVEVHTMRRIIFTLAGAAVLAACGAAGGTGTPSAPGTSAPAATGTTVSTGNDIPRHGSHQRARLHAVLLPAGEELDDRRVHRGLPHRLAAAGCHGIAHLDVGGHRHPRDGLGDGERGVSQRGHLQRLAAAHVRERHRARADDWPGSRAGCGLPRRPAPSSTSTGASSADSTPTPAAATPTQARQEVMDTDASQK